MTHIDQHAIAVSMPALAKTGNARTETAGSEAFSRFMKQPEPGADAPADKIQPQPPDTETRTDDMAPLSAGPIFPSQDPLLPSQAVDANIVIIAAPTQGVGAASPELPSTSVPTVNQKVGSPLLQGSENALPTGQSQEATQTQHPGAKGVFIPHTPGAEPMLPPQTSAETKQPDPVFGPPDVKNNSAPLRAANLHPIQNAPAEPAIDGSWQRSLNAVQSPLNPPISTLFNGLPSERALWAPQPAGSSALQPQPPLQPAIAWRTAPPAYTSTPAPLPDWKTALPLLPEAMTALAERPNEATLPGQVPTPATSSTSPLVTGHSSSHPVQLQGLMVRVREQAETGKPGRLELTLMPEELGKIRLFIQPEGDKLRLIVQAERPETLELLRKNTEAFADELRLSGFADASFNFSGWSDEPPPQAQDKTVSIQGPALSTAHAALPQMQRGAGPGLDLRV